ncbi:membrane protein [Streptomyces sp. CMC78]|uniref:Membrane protein n=1 Tax=Streptomyces sp. CMC78 TaxID=3231512 RepID=A0AB33KBU4_9ACTN
MSTTRHLVNRRRRLATAPPRTAETGPEPVSGATAGPVTTAEPDPPAAPDTDAEASTGTDTGTEAPADTPRARTPRLRVTLPVLLCALTVLLGAFAAWAFASAGSLRDEPARQNTALTDIGRTSEVKGRISEAVGAVFSYDYASPARSDRAASTYLTGRAVQQHKDMLADVREQAPKQKLVLTTTVTESGVEFLDGDRARLLVFADQSNTRTGKDEETTYAAAMFAVDAVRRGDSWLIAAIDTFTR